MNRALQLSIVALTLSFGLVACAKKKGPATTGMTESDTTGGTSGGSETDMTSGGAGGGLPTVHFDYNEYTIRSEDLEALRQAAETLKKGTTTLTIEGHADERGSNEYNLALGERRAHSVRSYLQKLGVDAKRLSTISFGEERPADPSSGESAWAKNRRAELVTGK